MLSCILHSILDLLCAVACILIYISKGTSLQGQLCCENNGYQGIVFKTEGHVRGSASTVSKSPGQLYWFDINLHQECLKNSGFLCTNRTISLVHSKWNPCLQFPQKDQIL